MTVMVMKMNTGKRKKIMNKNKEEEMMLIA
jgi:hypothetical protein